MPISEYTPRIARRTVLAGLAATVALTLVPWPSRAQGVEQAQALVTTLASEMTALVNSGSSSSQLYAEFEQILARYADMPAVSASILGPPWRGASAGQQQQFVAAFQTYLSRKYGRQFEEYRSASIEVSGARDAGRAGVLVETTVLRPSQAPIGVDWQISDRSGSAKVVNLIIEGVSMLANERAEVGAILEAQGGDIDGLISALQS